MRSSGRSCPTRKAPQTRCDEASHGPLGLPAVEIAVAWVVLNHGAGIGVLFLIHGILREPPEMGALQGRKVREEQCHARGCVETQLLPWHHAGCGVVVGVVLVSVVIELDNDEAQDAQRLEAPEAPSGGGGHARPVVEGKRLDPRRDFVEERPTDRAAPCGVGIRHVLEREGPH